MNIDLESLFDRYEAGKITRRSLLGLLATLITAERASAQAVEPSIGTIGTVKQLNHVTIFVEDVNKSVDFYQKLFGMPVLTRRDPGVNLKVGGGFLGVYPALNADNAGINHVCFGVENFDADATLAKVKELGLMGAISLRGDTKELYIMAPDKVLLQIQDVRYKGGVGPLGDREPE